MYALCIFKAGDRDKAVHFLDNEIVREPSDATLQTMKAYLLLEAGRDEDARGALRLAEAQNGSKLTRILHARACTRAQDKPCAEQAWTALTEDPSPPLIAFAELGRLELQAGDSSAAMTLASKALALSPRYIPALTLRREIGKK